MSIKARPQIITSLWKNGQLFLLKGRPHARLIFNEVPLKNDIPYLLNLFSPESPRNSDCSIKAHAVLLV